MFWGVTLENGKRYSQVVDGPFHVSMAALEPSENPKNTGNVSVYIEHQKSEFLLCTLQHNKNHQQRLSLNFVEGEEVTFFLAGDGIIHLTGYLLDEPGEQDSMEGSDEDDDMELMMKGEKRKGFEVSNNAKKIKPNAKFEDSDDVLDYLKNEASDSDEEDDDDDDDDPDKDSDLSDDPDLDSEDESIESDPDLIDSDNETSQNSTLKGRKQTPFYSNKKVSLTNASQKTSLETLKENTPKSKLALTPGKTPQRNDQANKSGGNFKNAQQVNKSGKTPNANEAKTPNANEAKTPTNHNKELNQNQNQNDTSSKKKRRKRKKSGGDNNASLASESGTPVVQKQQQQQPSKPQSKTPSTPGNKDMTKLPSGVQVQDLHVGSGPEAKAGKRVQVYYVGRLQNNKEFDALRGGKPFQFVLGKGEVIKGWEDGVKGMKVGGKRKIVVPPKEGYGSKQVGPIPPNSELHFEVTLKSVN